MEKADKNATRTFDFLGFSFYWGLSLKKIWVVKMKTAKDRFPRGISRISEWVRRNRHRPVKELIMSLWEKIAGHANYYGLPGNSKAVYAFQHEALRLLRKWLSRRSNDGCYTVERFQLLLKRYPRPKMHTRFLEADLLNLAKS